MSQNLKASKIVLACESEDAHALVNSVDRVLTEKLVDAIDTKKKAICGSILESTKSKDEDPYENYEPALKEAIDYVVESILEGGLELENTIHMAAKQYNVEAVQLKEYFHQLLGNRTELDVDSTSSDDHDEKGGVRDDQDTNKRVRYEEAELTFTNGQTMVIREGLWENTIEPVLSQLNESNREAFMSVLTKSKASFLKAVDFCNKVAKN
jgi:hypothetical protein